MFVWQCVITGDGTSEPPHQCPPLYEALSRKQQQHHHQLTKKTQGACLRYRTALHRGMPNISVFLNVYMQNIAQNMMMKQLCTVCLWAAPVEPA